MRRDFARASATLLLLGACAGTPDPAAAPRSLAAKIEIPAALESEVTAPAPPESDPPPDEVREPETPACRLVDKSWSFAALRLEAGGGVFASVSRAPTTVALPAGPPKAAIAVFDDTQLLLRAVVDANELALFPRVATTLGGFIVPKAGTLLSWSGGAPGKLRVGVVAKTVLTWPESVEDDVPCEKLALNVTGFDTRARVTARTSLPERLVLRKDAELALSPGGEAVARLRDGLRVELLQVEAAHARVLIEERTFSAFGWVRSSDLGPAPTLARMGRLGGSHRTIPPYVRDGRTCLRDLSLSAALGERRVRVGVLRKGTRFVVDAGQPDSAPDPGTPPPRRSQREIRYVSIRLPMTRWLALAEGARLLVPEDEYRECDVPPVPSGT